MPSPLSFFFAIHRGVHANWLVLAALLSLALGRACLADEAGPVLPAESIAFDGGEVILDKLLVEHRDWVVETVEAEVQAAKRAHAIDHAAIQRVGRAMTDAAFDLLGQDKQAELYDRVLERCMDNLVKSESPAYVLPDSVRIFVLHHTTAKAYLRAGGTLPFISYDADQDKASIRIGSMADARNVPLPEAAFIVGANLAAGDEDTFDQATLSEMLRFYFYLKDEFNTLLGDRAAGLPADTPGIPLNAMSLLDASWVLSGSILKAKTALYDDAHTYWFTTGMDVVVGTAVLNQIGAERAAALSLAMFQTENDVITDLPKELGTPAYLRFVPRHRIILSGSKLDEVLNDARFSASVQEVDRLVEHLTPARLPELFRLLEDPTIDTTAKLEAAIEQRFGYDVSARLDLYQPAGDAQTLYNAMIAEAFERRAAGDLSAMAHALNRAQEIQFGRAIADVPGIYKLLLTTLDPFNGEHVGRSTLLARWWTVATRQPEPATDDLLQKLAARWLKEAVNARNLRLAYDLLNKLDERELTFDNAGPGGPVAEQFVRLVRASKHIDAGEIESARRLIEQARRDFPRGGPAELIEQLLEPNIDFLEMRINAQRPSAPVLGRAGRIDARRLASADGRTRVASALSCTP